MIGSLSVKGGIMSSASSSLVERPNILLIMSDEHDPGVMGCYGDPVVQTPNMDRLASEGIIFDAAYTTSPLCVPARLSFTAGKYISRCGAWSNNCWLPSDDYPSLPRILSTSGYECWLGGKMHYDKTRRYGFRDLFPTNQNASNKHGLGRRRRADDTAPNFESWENRSKNFYVADTSMVLELDREVTEKCGAFLEDRRPGDKPFFLLAGYLSPHFPLIVPEQYYERYRDRVPMPEIPNGFLETLPTNYKHLRYGFGLTETEPEVVKFGRELYWGFVDWLDDEIGKLLTSLESSGVAENTIVIYTSDHGENKGDHGLWWKNNMYEHAARMPLIVNWTGRWRGGQRRSGACSLVDLVRTIAEICGTETPDDWDGDSMLAWMDDENVEWKDLAASEYYGHNIASGFTMLRQGPWKYVYHNRMDENHGPEVELYNLDDDPSEFQNLADRPEHQDRVAAMHSLLVKELGNDPEDTEARCRADYARVYGR